jgi:hypothetical protein
VVKAFYALLDRYTLESSVRNRPAIARVLRIDATGVRTH